MSKAMKYLWILLAGLVLVLIVTRMDRKIFEGSPAVVGIKNQADEFVLKMKRTRGKLATFVAEKDFGIFTLKDPSEVEDAAGQMEADRMTSLKVSGMMKTSEGLVMASVNGSLVEKGSRVRGCEVLDVTEKGVLFDVAGEEVFVGIYKEYSFKKIRTGPLILEKVISEDGQNKAVINGQAYNAGDWVDGDTKVKAVTTGRVLLDVAGARVFLKVEESR